MSAEDKSFLISLEELIASYAPVYPDAHRWHETVSYLYESEPAHMEELRESLESYELREPIVLSREPVMEGDSRGQVRDGTHRVSLAIRAKQSQIRAIFKDDLPENDMQQLVLTIELLSGALNDEEESDLLDRFRSWKLDENHWLTSSIIFGSQGRWEIFLDFSKEELSEAIALRAQELLESQFPSSSFSATVALAESFD